MWFEYVELLVFGLYYVFVVLCDGLCGFFVYVVWFVVEM